MQLPSGSFLPAGLLQPSDTAMDTMRGFNHQYGNFGIKAGIVIENYEIDDDLNITKAVPEYDVAVFEQNADGAQNTIVYKNCIAADVFGAIADYLEYRYRVQAKVDEKDAGRVAIQQDGAIVMIMCLNGVGDKAVIVGGLAHPKRSTDLTKEAGHTLLGEFNGLQFGVDKDGALKIAFKGATGNDGTPADASVGGSYIKIEKDGSLEFGDTGGVDPRPTLASASGSDDSAAPDASKNDYFRIDKTKQTIDLASQKAMSLKTMDALNTTSAGATNMGMKDWMVKATGSASLQVASLDVKSDAAITMNGSSYTLKSSGIFTIQGQQIVLDGMTFLGGQGGSPAIVATTQFLGTGNLGLPVLSTAIGPFSSKVFISP